MTSTSDLVQSPVDLEQLLLRDDLWLGHSGRFAQRDALSTGHAVLDEELIHGGWPRGCLIEICQQYMQAEWLLLSPALRTTDGLIFLVNPPAIPFSQWLIQAGIDPARLIVVEAEKRVDFIGCFAELSRSAAGAVIAWQPKELPTYTDLRKCHLAAAEDAQGMSLIIRPAQLQQQSSPAALRVFAQLVAGAVEVTVFKQKGQLQTRQPLPVRIDLPAQWQASLPFHQLHQQGSDDSSGTDRRIAPVVPLRKRP